MLLDQCGTSAALARAAPEHDDVARELAEMRASREETTRSFDREHARELSELEAKNATMQNALENKATEIDALRAALETKTAESEAKSSDSEAATANLREELQHKSTEIHVLRNALETKKAEFERAMDEISTLRASERTFRSSGPPCTASRSCTSTVPPVRRSRAR